MEGDLIDAGLSLWREVELFLRSMTSPWRIYKIGIILALLAVAHVLSVVVGHRLEDWLRSREGWPRWQLRVSVIVIKRLRGVFFVMLIGAAYPDRPDFAQRGYLPLDARAGHQGVAIDLLRRCHRHRAARAGV